MRDFLHSPLHFLAFLPVFSLDMFPYTLQGLQGQERKDDGENCLLGSYSLASVRNAKRF